LKKAKGKQKTQIEEKKKLEFTLVSHLVLSNFQNAVGLMHGFWNKFFFNFVTCTSLVTATYMYVHIG